jgi:hypothetical protein
MVCSFPALDVPPLFLGLLDLQPYTPSVPYGQAPTGDDVDPILNPPKCPLYQRTNSLKAEQIDFVIGFVFDGWKTTYVDDVLEVYPPPNICFNSSLQIYDGNDMEIVVSWRPLLSYP